MTIAVIDSGIDTGNLEFDGRISAASTDVAGNGTVQQEDDHGTLVALVAAAARDDFGIMGIAYEATIMAIRADEPGSCAAGDCGFFDEDIAAGVDHAVANGARIINISLGGGAPNSTVRDAVANAAAAGVVVIISAGNDGGISPDLFAAGLRQAGGDNVIIAGSVDLSGDISDFSNRAGIGANADYYLTAAGEALCCVYEGSDIYVDAEGFIYLMSGTSFAAPQISGAAALLAQAFPHLSAAQIVSLLLDTAGDAGGAGTDSTFGRGIMDIAAAFAPQGATSLAGTRRPLPSGDSTAIGSAAMGDALQTASLGAIILDGYDRAYAVDLAQSLRSATIMPRLSSALSGNSRVVGGGNDKASYAFTIDARGGLSGVPWMHGLSLTQDDAEQARVLAARVAFRLSPDTQLGFAFAQSPDGLVGQLQGQDRPVFMIASHAAEDEGFRRDTELSLAMRRRLGQWGLTLSAEKGQILADGPLDFSDETRGRRKRDAMHGFGLALDRDFGGLNAVLGVNWLREDRTLLGARFHDAFGARGADTMFLDAAANWHFADGWRLGVAARNGWTYARAGGVISGGTPFMSRAWSLDLQRRGVFGGRDSLALRVAQPLRVEHGGLGLELPVAYDYTAGTAILGARQLNLVPKGREIMSELSWNGPLWAGRATASLFYRNQPGHFANVPADKGAAIRWNTQF